MAKTSQNSEKSMARGILIVSYKFKMAGKNSGKMVKKDS
jgi:hypothetical protein